MLHGGCLSFLWEWGRGDCNICSLQQTPLHTVPASHRCSVQTDHLNYHMLPKGYFLAQGYYYFFFTATSIQIQCKSTVNIISGNILHINLYTCIIFSLSFFIYESVLCFSNPTFKIVKHFLFFWSICNAAQFIHFILSPNVEIGVFCSTWVKLFFSHGTLKSFQQDCSCSDPPSWKWW